MESRSLNNILAVSVVPLLAVVAASAAVAGGGRDFDVPTRLCAAALAVLLAVYVAWVAWRDTFRMLKVALVASMMLAFWPLMAFDGALAVVVAIAPIAGLGVGYAVLGRRSQVRSVLLARDPRTLDAEGVFFHCAKVVPDPDGVHLELALENGWTGRRTLVLSFQWEVGRPEVHRVSLEPGQHRLQALRVAVPGELPAGRHRLWLDVETEGLWGRRVVHQRGLEVSPRVRPAEQLALLPAGIFTWGGGVWFDIQLNVAQPGPPTG